MIPILQTENEIIGFLPNALSCTVTEERNGIFELELTYPVSAPMFSSLAVDKFINAKPNDTSENQLFRIYEITKPINNIVTVSAEHITYALSHLPVCDVSGSYTPVGAMTAILSNAKSNAGKDHGFSASSDISAIKDFSFALGSARSALGGTDGSVLDLYGGEFEFNNKIITLHKSRGKDTGVIISYGKNLTDIKATTSMEEAYTHLFPYAKKDDSNIYIENKIIEVKNSSGISQRVLMKDFSSFFSDGEEITSATLLTKANTWLKSNDINSPNINVTVSFVHLWQSPEYSSLAALEKVSLCDTVTVRHTLLGVDIKAKVIKTVYDSISERYEKLEIGSAKANFSDTLSQKVKEETKENVKGITSDITESYLAAIDSATKAITGYSGGYVVLNPSKNPQELLVMNTADKSTATKVWRWNINGLGYSKNGYNGNFSTAITMNGEIVADFITAGSLTANVIKAGVLQDSSGKTSFNLESGLLTTSNISVTGGSIKIGSSDYYTYISDGSIEQYGAEKGVLIGGLVPIMGSEYAECLYYDSANAVVKNVSISYKKSDGTFKSMAEFSSDYASFFVPIKLDDLGDTSITSSNNSYSGHTHTRKNVSVNREKVSGKVDAGVGIASAYNTLQTFANYTAISSPNKTKEDYSYYAVTNLTSTSTCYSLTKDIDCTGFAKVKVSFSANSYGWGHIKLFYKIKDSSTLYIGETLITVKNSDVSYEDTLDIPEEAVSFRIGVTPDTGYSDYWTGWRDVKIRLYQQGLSASLQLRDSDDKIESRLDCYKSAGEALIGLKGMTGSDTTGGLELGSESLWWRGNVISSNSSEKFKTDIETYENSALDLINSSKIYGYYYKDKEGKPAGKKKYGLVIERECPKEIVDNSEDSISLYSMISLAWKGIQELNNKMEEQNGRKN